MGSKRLRNVELAIDLSQEKTNFGSVHLYLFPKDEKFIAQGSYELGLPTLPGESEPRQIIFDVLYQLVPMTVFYSQAPQVVVLNNQNQGPGDRN